MRIPATRTSLAAAVAVAMGCASHVAPPAPAPALDGRCGTDPGICLLGVPAPLGDGGETFGWQCLGVNGGASAACSVDLSRVVDQSITVEAAVPRETAVLPAAQRPPPAGPAEVAEAAGQTPVARGRQRIADLLAAKARRTPAQRKVGSELLERAAAEALRASGGFLQEDRRPPRDAVPDDELGEDGRVLVDIRTDVSPAVLARIRELGGAVVTSVPEYRAIRALLPLRVRANITS